MDFAYAFVTISGERQEMIDCQTRMLHTPTTKKRVSLHAVCPKGPHPQETLRPCQVPALEGLRHIPW